MLFLAQMEDMISFKKVENQTDIRSIANLAHEIWNQHFVSIIGQAQVDYMLEKFQSPHAITKQLEEGYDYYIILSDHNKVGYLGLLSEENLNRLMISKIYIKKQARGTGVGNEVLKFVKNLSKGDKIDIIWLTVNKYNKNTIDWYLRKGFDVVDEVKKDIGNGFFMDDYIMELKIG